MDLMELWEIRIDKLPAPRVGKSLWHWPRSNPPRTL